MILKEESYKIIGICMEVHTNLGMGFKEAVYKGCPGSRIQIAECSIYERKAV